MNSNCKQFRLCLRAALEGGLSGETAAFQSVRPISWHEHLFTCNECRDLLEAEEALEQVLASLPEPTIPRALAQRVLDRLTAARLTADPSGLVDLDNLLARDSEISVPTGLADMVLQGLAGERAGGSEVALDNLLDKVPSAVAPKGLASRVLAGVNVEREAQLGALLDLVPAPEIPVGLADRILDSLDAERAAIGEAPILRPRFGAVRFVAAIAATLVVSFGVWRMTDSSDGPVDPNGRGEGVVDTQPGPVDPRPIHNVITSGTSEEVASLDTEAGVGTSDFVPEPVIEVAPTVALPDPSVLASLDVLEDWELLMSEDIDLLLGSLDEADAELLFLVAEEESTEEG